ncbi:hypothetical protein EOT00_06440 [Listeria seeligeri]|uniref:hypothetical protein n=1 Tax=Listeria seeligeri TaxID=1640 RepID=UPI00111B798A|nr:hypothetical protein [Listeria seeligeri]QDA74595.1 hypothetical protein EOT00_06440 [Listeria seeligeri]
MEKIKSIRKLVTVNDEETYTITIVPIDDSTGRKTFKGIKVNMLDKNGDHFAQDTFPSTVNPGIVRAWIVNMHNASNKIENMMVEFDKWDGELHEYW